jgi:hypothetical protein
MLRRSLRIAGWVGLVAGWFLFNGPAARAYIDPGSGSFLVQILIGVAFGGALAIATFWRRISAFLSRVFGKKKQEASPTQDEA